MSFDPIKILCLINWQTEPDYRWFWDHVPGNQDTVDFVNIKNPPDRFPGYGKLLGYYQRFFLLGLKAFPRMADYDVIVSWEGNNGIPLAFFRTFFGRTQKPFVILNFVLKGPVVLNNLWFIRYALRSVDKIVCVSQKEVVYYSEKLKIPQDRFVKIPTMWPDRHINVPISSGDYIFSAGRSHRDYKTLIEAVRDLPVRLVINARPFNLKGLTPPDNVTFNPFLPQNEFLDLLRNARFTVLPLFEAKHASGETFLLESMSAHKAVIATKTFTLVDFIQPGVNGDLVDPGDVSGMRTAIQNLLEQPEKTQEMGRTARKMYLNNWSLPVVGQQISSLLHEQAN